MIPLIGCFKSPMPCPFTGPKMFCAGPNFMRNLQVNKAPLYTKLTLMDCGIGNTNLLGSSSSGLGYDRFYMKSTDGATMY